MRVFYRYGASLPGPSGRRSSAVIPVKSFILIIWNKEILNSPISFQRMETKHVDPELTTATILREKERLEHW